MSEELWLAGQTSEGERERKSSPTMSDRINREKMKKMNKRALVQKCRFVKFGAHDKTTIVFRKDFFWAVWRLYNLICLPFISLRPSTRWAWLPARFTLLIGREKTKSEAYNWKWGKREKVSFLVVKEVEIKLKKGNVKVEISVSII